MTLVQQIALCLVLMALSVDPWVALRVSGAWLIFAQ